MSNERVPKIRSDGTRVRRVFVEPIKTRRVFVEPIKTPELGVRSVRLFSFQGQMKSTLTKPISP